MSGRGTPPVLLPAECPLAYITFDKEAIAKGLAQFRERLDHSSMDESEHILPLFKEFPALGALIITVFGLSNTRNAIAIKSELKVGFFRADLVIADLTRNAYLLVEFEHGHHDSVFKRKNRNTPEWSDTFEHGYSQVVDWFWWLDANVNASEYKRIFLRPDPRIIGLLVTGRELPGHEREMRERLNWRIQKTVIDSNHILFMNYDELYQSLEASWQAM